MNSLNTLTSHSPIDGKKIGEAPVTALPDVEAAIERAQAAFRLWRNVPAPRRGELVRIFGEELRRDKDALSALVTLEAGKIVSEGQGEVQEMTSAISPSDSLVSFTASPLHRSVRAIG